MDPGSRNDLAARTFDPLHITGGITKARPAELSALAQARIEVTK